MDEKQIEVFRNQLSSGTSLSGSLLPKLLDGLTPQELAQLRSKALEGHLGIELERLKMQDRLSASQTEIDAFISTVARLERQTNSPFASYKADFSAKGASGETTITSKRVASWPQLSMPTPGIRMFAYCAPSGTRSSKPSPKVGPSRRGITATERRSPARLSGEGFLGKQFELVYCACALPCGYRRRFGNGNKAALR